PHPRPRGRTATGADHPDGRRPQPDQPAFRVPLPHAVLESAGHLRDRGAAAPADRRTPGGRLPLRLMLRGDGCAATYPRCRRSDSVLTMPPTVTLKDIRMPRHSSDSPTGQRTHRYLRLALVGLVLTLLIAVSVEIVRSGTVLPSISHYFYSPARNVFV